MTQSTKCDIIWEARKHLPSPYTYEHGHYTVPIYYHGEWIEVIFYIRAEWHPSEIIYYWQTNF